MPTDPADEDAPRPWPRHRGFVAALLLLALLLAGGWRLGGGTPAAAALPQASLEQLLRTGGTDWQLARLRQQPAVLVIGFPSLDEQGRALNRVAALIEKAQAPRDRVLDDEALDDLIESTGSTPANFYFGHDYTAASLARFYTLARRQSLALNAQEKRLLALLLAEQMLSDAGSHYAATLVPAALVSYSEPGGELDAAMREAVLRHELSHGLFFTSPAYRDHCLAFWHGVLSDEQRERFRRFLAGLDYDAADEELMANETQAFLMHTPDERAFAPDMVGLDSAGLEALRERFRRGAPPGTLPAR